MVRTLADEGPMKPPTAAERRRGTVNDVLVDIDDLIVQATTEKSHYYTARVLVRAAAEIARLRAALLRERGGERGKRK